jgi:glucose/arabinose dehydrogenase/PKD repeat protein
MYYPIFKIGNRMILSLLLAVIFLDTWRYCFAVPNGFVEEGLVDLKAITGAFAPNPRNGGKPMLLLSSKEGMINVLEDPDNSDNSFQIADMSSILCTDGERGLQTILPHPNFSSNRFIFMYYNRKTGNCDEDATSGPSNRLSRFTMSASTLQIDLSSEVVLLETPPAPKHMHNGGAMAIGNDGFLYLTTGDAGTRDPPYSQDLRNLYGKVMRLDLDGNVPSSNPFTTASGRNGVSCRKSKGRPPSGSPSDAVCEEIFSYGLRNPFRIAMNPNVKNKVQFAIMDVGASVWEEINNGGTDYRGTNYRWPDFEGPCKRGTFNDCPKAGSGSTDPFYYYLHTGLSAGGACTGAVFVPDGLWPDKYDYLFIDFVFGKVFNLIPDSGRECRSCTPPIPAFRNETFHSHPSLVDMFFGPYKNTKALYLVSRSEGQNVRRIHYTGSSNSAPTARITVKTSAAINENIAFKGSDSSDADGDALTFLWDFGDGRTSTEINPTQSYSKLGQYKVTLTVTDTRDQKSQASVTIVVGSPPTATMNSPAVGNQFIVGERLYLSGSATDSSGTTLNDAQFSWEVRQHHASHYHPFLDVTFGNNFLLYPAPAPEDFTAATNSYLEVIMYATDSNGLKTTISRNVQPKKVLIDIDSKPQGLVVMVDEFPVTTPATITSWQNHSLRLDVNDQGSNIWASWSIGGSRKTTFRVPEKSSTNPTIIANFGSSTGPVARPAPRPAPTPTVPQPAPTSAPRPAPVSVPTAPLPALSSVIKDCSPTNQCRRCQGDCESDADCVGNLICYQKGSGLPGVVPSCSGLDLTKTDWCVLPS